MAAVIFRWALLVAFLLPATVGAADAERLDESGSSTDRYLNSHELLEVLHGGNEGFFDCFRQHSGPGDPGEVTLSLTVSRRGEVMRPQVEVDDGKEALQGCLETFAVELRFPSHDAAPIELAYPLVFRSDLEFGTAVLNYPMVFVRYPPRQFSILELPQGLSEADLRLLEVLLWQPLQLPPASPADEP